jgi:hypothetical protein
MTSKPASEFVAGAEGLFQIPAALYHDHLRCPDVSRSLVVEMITKSPAHAKAMIDGLVVKKETPAMILGTLTDMALLEPHRFKEGQSHHVRPPGMKFTTKDGKAWQEDHAGLPIITADESVDITGMIQSVLRHKTGRLIVEQSVKQESAFCKDPDTGLLRKSRPDMRLEDRDSDLTLTDLKSTFYGGASPPVWSAHCARMGLHYQDAFYSDIYKDLLGPNPFFIFLVVERKPPYACRVFQIHNEGRMVARERYKRALERFAKCRADQNWTPYDEEIETIRLPNWEIRAQDPIVIE